MEEWYQKLSEFLEKRNWQQFHTPKNLSMSIAIEAAEIMELFQWLTNEESLEAVENPDFKDALSQEIADVLIYLVSLARVSGIDLKRAFVEKMEANELRFSPEKSSMDTLEEKLKRTLQKE